MWTVLALALLAPVGWALLGAQPIRAWEPWADQHLPGWLSTPVEVSTQAIVVAVMVGMVLGLGRARVATRHLSTLAHEVGHGLTAALFGARIDRITLSPDGSGMAHFTFPFRRPVLRFAVAFAGYAAPGVFGVASMQVALAGRGTVWLVYMTGLLVTMLVLVVRSWWGALLAVGLGMVGWGLLTFGSGWLATVVVAALAGSLFGGGVVDALGQWQLARSSMATDAASMAAQTRLPVRFWAGVQMAFAVVLAGVGIALPFLG